MWGRSYNTYTWAKFNTYAEWLALYETARNKITGKPISTARLFMGSDGLLKVGHKSLYYEQSEVSLFPDDTLEIMLSPFGASAPIENSLGWYYAHLMVPVVSTHNPPGPWHWTVRGERLFRGARICMRRGVVVNPREFADPYREEDKEKSAAWRKQYTRVRRMFEVMCKVGAFDDMEQIHFISGHERNLALANFIQNERFSDLASYVKPLLYGYDEYVYRTGETVRATMRSHGAQALAKAYSRQRSAVREAVGAIRLVTPDNPQPRPAA